MLYKLRRTGAAQRILLILFLTLVTIAVILSQNGAEEPPADIDGADTTVSSAAEAAIDQEVVSHMREILPSDYTSCFWKLLDRTESKQQLTVYILTFYHGFSGSPAIFDNGQPRIACDEFLPAVLTFDRGQNDLYQLTSYWEPSPENYAEEIQEKFPAATAQAILNRWAALQQDMEAENDGMGDLSSCEPIWPSYRFDMDDQYLCNLIDYYGENDIYTIPVREELEKRFNHTPVDFLNGLSACEQDVQSHVCSILLALQDNPEFIAAMNLLKQNKNQLSDSGISLLADMHAKCVSSSSC